MLVLRRALNDKGRCQDVVAHRLVYCESALAMAPEELHLTCEYCARFLAYCCPCTANQLDAARRRRRFTSARADDEPPFKVCHYHKVVYVDGACLNNGQDGAIAGIGIAVGADPLTMHWAVTVDDAIDPCFARTSQRAELLAAIHGIRKIAEYEDEEKGTLDVSMEEHRDSKAKVAWVIASDSEYVVSGMTEWVPVWKNNGWRNSSGKRPKNLDLFQSLDTTVNHHEHKYNVQIAFWRIDRAQNELAKYLARSAAKGHTVEPVQLSGCICHCSRP